MAHRDAVVDRDGIELLADPAGALDLADRDLPEILEVHVAGGELLNELATATIGLPKSPSFMPGGAPQGARAGHVPLSLHVKTLEDELGVRLFHRSNRGVTLTPAGQVFYDETRSALRRMSPAAARTVTPATPRDSP